MLQTYALRNRLDKTPQARRTNIPGISPKRLAPVSHVAIDGLSPRRMLTATSTFITRNVGECPT